MQADFNGLLCDMTRPSHIPPHRSDIAEGVVALTQIDLPAEATHWTAATKAVGISANSHDRRGHQVPAFDARNHDPG